MTTKRILILAPLVLTAILLQSYFWVPTYEQQAKGNPRRLNQYINASIGDAAILNPILSADSASSEITGKVFEGLIDRDEELRFRARLATRWKIYEHAFFYVNAGADVPGLGRAAAPDIVNFLQEARTKKYPASAKLQKTLDNIASVTLIPARTERVRASKAPSDDNQKADTIDITVAAPARIKLDLKTVDQDLFVNLGQILGKNYFSSFEGATYLSAKRKLDAQLLDVYAQQYLPSVEHNPIIEFRLRPNVKFHDGHSLDAHDVKFTYDAIMDPKNLSPRIADYEPVKKVLVIDPLTVRIVYKRLYSPAIGTWSMGILPEHLLNDAVLKKEALKLGKDPQSFSLRQSGFNRHPIGCGPFVFREWVSDQYIILDRFEEYWEGPPHYQKYVFRVIPDLLTQEMEFYAGTIDSYGVQPHQVKRLKDDPNFQSFSGTSFGFSYIGYNMRREPFDDRRVRQALSMAIDVDKIIEYVLYNQGERITGPFPKQTDFYNPDVEPVPYDPQGALKLLAQAGWRRNADGWLEKNGKRLQFKLITNNGNDIRKAILAIAQDSWKQIGVDVRTDLVEWAVFIQERVNKLDFDALVLGWSMGIDPDLYQIWHSSQTGYSQLNFVGFKNKEADRLIIKIRQEYNHEQQVEYCHRLHDIIAYEQPYTFLFVSRWTAVLDKRIVIKEFDQNANIVYRKITPTPTGDYTFYFNRWIKLAQVPDFAP
ncbi:MAG: peptide ABC transporter substrate-binding protein [Deltaproteobacteria bacterium]|jgi:ABC-type transport system substrate-binding protein|nr:peptide ABC transporter substrate-binding protein [Deltaproteobacteria bacterium]